ncbi:unnamed protein product [Vitrella brassicaformis CCMP3155]|uniref:Uncharacterized protein n=1 Tax=Vitrella brassicaformis (strain CCMP3155) TaxID=1169540 RepID=A0A0G4EWA0_VITBC|nr:unnamed protein product [Vitrella brassicaformis CCMP3155]|eukprot:CEM02625.1 unnamed protein product [Vitrella brassicaformis CCMP3155]
MSRDARGEMMSHLDKNIQKESEVHVALRLRGGVRRAGKGREKESDTAPWPLLTHSTPRPPASENPSAILTKWAYYDPVYEVEMMDGQLQKAAQLSGCTEGRSPRLAEDHGDESPEGHREDRSRRGEGPPPPAAAAEAAAPLKPLTSSKRDTISPPLRAGHNVAAQCPECAANKEALYKKREKMGK